MLHAVVVGIDRYLDARITPLECAKADATAVARLLENGIEPDEREVRLLLDGEATRRNLMTAIVDDLRREVESEDIVFISFAGHGCPERMGAQDECSRYLIAHDSEYDRLRATAIDLQRDVADWIDAVKLADMVVIALDACFSGRAGGRTILGPELARTAALKGFLADENLVSLKGLDLGSGRVILCAADDDEVAREMPQSGHGVFTRHLLKGLQRPRGTDRSVRITDLFNEVEDGVGADTANQQHPVMSLIKGSRPSLPILHG